MNKNLSSTPAPKKDQIKGSKVNPKGSASSEKSASQIKLDAKTIVALSNKLKEFRESHTNKNITLNDLKAVYRRGLGAYSTSHRPNIPRNAWAMARVNKFLEKAAGKKVKAAYVQDDDLLKMHLGGDIRYENGGEVDKFIEDGIVELKMYDTTNDHSKIYGFDAEKPLYIQTIIVSKEHRGKGIGSKVMEYIVDYANKNGHDVIFGNITQKAEPNIDVIKSMIVKSGFNTIEGNDDFYKVMNKDVSETGQDIKCRRCGWEWNTSQSEEFDKYVCHNCGFDNRTFYDTDPIGYKETNKVKLFYNWYLDSYKKIKNEITLIITLPNKLTPFLEDNVVIIENFQKNNPSVKAYKYMQQIIDKADEYKVTIYLEPTPIGYTKTRLELIEYYKNLGFELSKDKEFMKRLPKYKDGGELTNACIEEVVDIINSIQEVKDYYIVNRKLVILFQEELMVYSVEMMNYHLGKFTICHDIVDPEININNKEDYKSIFLNLKNDEATIGEFKEGGEVDDKKKTYAKWKSLVNMSYGEIKRFYDSKEGKEAGLSTKEANEQGISSGRESARWAMKMKNTKASDWTPTMWKWANKQISFISRMSGNKGGLYDDKGNKTRKHTSLLIWGNNPKKESSMKYENGGEMDVRMEDTVQRMDNPNFADISYYNNGGEVIYKVFGKDRYINVKPTDKVRSFRNLRSFAVSNNLGANILKFQGGYYAVYPDNKMIKLFTNLNDVTYEELYQMLGKSHNNSYNNGGRINYSEYYKKGGKTNSCEKFDSKGERKIDLKSIEELTECVNNLPQTKDLHFHNGQYDADRKKLHKEIIYKIKKNLVCIESDKPIAILMGGSPASGKSTFLRKYRPYLLENEILKVDADEIRSQLPEYEGYNATQTHLETKDIVNLLLSDRNIGIPCRFDLIYDGTMNNTKSYLPLIELLKSLGYRIFVVYIDKVPKDEIVKRALERYKKSGRFVPLEVIDDFFYRGKTALNEIKKQVDGYMIVDGSSSNYYVIEKGGMQLPKNRRYSKIGEPINITTQDVVREYKRGGELNPDNTQLKNQVVHKSGEIGGLLVGNRHSEGGIKAINKSTGQPLEMEGGEVVITRNAVSDGKKRLFQGEMLTNREILSKINQSGGGVSFAKGGSIKKNDCGCSNYDEGGTVTKGENIVSKMQKLYPKDFNKVVNEETREDSNRFKSFKKSDISLKETVKMVVAKQLQDKNNYYKNYNLGGYITLGELKVPSFKEFINLGYSIISPFENDDSIYIMLPNSTNDDEKYYRDGDNKGKRISNLLAYKTYLYDNFGILFSQLPIKVKNGLTLGKQSLIDNYINS